MATQRPPMRRTLREALAEAEARFGSRAAFAREICRRSYPELSALSEDEMRGLEYQYRAGTGDPLGSRLHATTSTVSKWFTKGEEPGTWSYGALCEILGVSLGELGEMVLRDRLAKAPPSYLPPDY